MIPFQVINELLITSLKLINERCQYQPKYFLDYLNQWWKIVILDLIGGMLFFRTDKDADQSMTFSYDALSGLLHTVSCPKKVPLFLGLYLLVAHPFLLVVNAVAGIVDVFTDLVKQSKRGTSELLTQTSSALQSSDTELNNRLNVTQDVQDVLTDKPAEQIWVDAYSALIKHDTEDNIAIVPPVLRESSACLTPYYAYMSADGQTTDQSDDELSVVHSSSLKDQSAMTIYGCFASI
jgi:hypothetical protein